MSDPRVMTVDCGSFIRSITSWGEDLLLLCQDRFVLLNEKRYLAASLPSKYYEYGVYTFRDRAYLTSSDRGGSLRVMDKSLSIVIHLQPGVIGGVFFHNEGAYCSILEWRGAYAYVRTLFTFYLDDYRRQYYIDVGDLSPPRPLKPSSSHWPPDSRYPNLVREVGVWGGCIFGHYELPSDNLVVWDSDWKVTRVHSTSGLFSHKIWNQYLICTNETRAEIMTPDQHHPLHVINVCDRVLPVDDYLLVCFSLNSAPVYLMNQSFEYEEQDTLGLPINHAWKGMTLYRWSKTLTGFSTSRLRTLSEGPDSK
jgi:hypothetical protein